MKRALTLIGIVLAVGAVGLALWTKERRQDDDYECALERVRDLTAGCDVMSWWPAITVGVVAVAVLVVASKLDPPRAD